MAPLGLPQAGLPPGRAVPVCMQLVVADLCLQHSLVAGLVVLERCRSCLWVGSQIRRDLRGRQGLVALPAVVPLG